MAFARRHRLAIELMLLVLVAYLAAVGASTALENATLTLPPASEAAAPTTVTPVAPLADYAVIAERDIFNPTRAAGEAAGTRSGTLRLWGIGMHGDEARAVIEDVATRRQELYRVGDTVGGARLTAIDWDRVTLAYAGGEEVLELAPPAEGTPDVAAPATAVASRPDEHIRRTSENAFVVDRRELDGAVDNMSGLLTQLRAVAEVHDGRPAGFRVFQYREGSLFARLGLRDGDVVRRVNGSEIGEPTALLGFLARLRTEPRVALDIVRGDAPRTLVYDLR